MEVMHPRCAGIDVSKRDAKVCIRIQGGNGRKTSSTVTTWGAMTNQILALRDHLAAQRVTVVVMEATATMAAVLLRPGDRFRGDAGQRPEVKNVPGRKSDVSDAAWLADLGAHGLVRASFVPPEPIRQLRDLTRTRTHITQERTREVQRLEKLLESAGIKLSSVATDITGVSGRLMLQALIDSHGTADPAAMAELAKRRMRSKIPVLTEALNGRFTAHHAFMTRMFLDRIDVHTKDIATLSERIDELMKPFLPARELLESIPGFSQIIAEIFIAETGGDMTQFPTPDTGVLGRCQPGLQRIRRPGQVHQDPTREPLPQRRSRRRRAEPGQVEEHLLLREVPPAGLHPRPDEGPRRRRTRDDHRRMAHAHQRRVLPRPRPRLLHPTRPREDQGPRRQTTGSPRIPGHHPPSRAGRLADKHTETTAASGPPWR